MARSTLGLVGKLVFFSALGLGSAACAHAVSEGTETVIEGQYASDGGSTSGVTSGAEPATTTGSVASTSAGTGGAPGTSATTSASSSAQVSATSGGPSTGSGGTCEASGDCGACGNCAVNGACAAAANGCSSNQLCLGLLGCLNTCTDQACADACANSYPGGLDLYLAVTTCVLCTACPVSCDGPSSGACAP